MRYREGLTPGSLGAPAGTDMLVFTAVLGLIIGLVCVAMGWRGRFMWLKVWGLGLTVASLGYLAHLLAG